MPEDLGVTDGRLRSCPDSPNCVVSGAEDPQHAIEPLVVERGASSHPNPPQDFALRPGDRLLVLGGAENLLRLRQLLEAPPEARD